MQSWCISVPKEKENELNPNPVRMNAGLSDRDKRPQGFGLWHEIKEIHVMLPVLMKKKR